MSQYKYSYTIDNGSESLIVKDFDNNIVIDRKYKNGYCLINLIFDQKIILIKCDLKQRIEQFVESYHEYFKTKNYDHISDTIIKASSSRITVGTVLDGVPVSMTTSDIDKLCDFIIVMIYRHELMLTYRGLSYDI